VSRRDREALAVTPTTSRDPARIAVLTSGRGSNLEAIFMHLDSRGARRGGDVVLVASDRADAAALSRARARDVPAAHITNPNDGPAIDALLHAHEVDLIALAGYLRLVPAAVTGRFRGRLLNVHPALLPAFGGTGMYGLRVHRAVLDAGAAISGVTVHFVDEVYDRGPIIAQWPVVVRSTDTPDSLAARVLRLEHTLYPRVVEAVAAGRLELSADNRVWRNAALGEADVFSLGEDQVALGAAIDRMLGS
jgi:formyltetrahydrofolate-dependent phosphoribosylglycinamide formyltransferase